MAVNDYKQICYMTGSLVTKVPSKAVEAFLQSKGDGEKVSLNLVFVLRRRQNVESWLSQFKKGVASGWGKVRGGLLYDGAEDFCDKLAVVEQRNATDEEQEWYKDCFGGVSLSNRDQFVCLRLE